MTMMRQSSGYVRQILRTQNLYILSRMNIIIMMAICNKVIAYYDYAEIQLPAQELNGISLVN
jgi:hypothetical protein